MSVKRYTLEMVSSEAGHIHWMHDNEEGLSAPLGEYVLHSDYARLKAEVKRLTSGINPEGHNDLAGRAVEHCLKLQAEVEALKLGSLLTAVDVLQFIKLKAEIERLTKELADEKSANANVENRQQDRLRGLSMENFNLKAEVERLRKELAEAQENYHLVNEMVARLRKEGKQS